MIPRWWHGVMLVLLFLTGACAEGARFARVDEGGGVVIYPLKKDRESIYATPFRAEALQKIHEHCHGTYIITREGETTPEMRHTGRDSDEPLTERRFWGLEFKCK